MRIALVVAADEAELIGGAGGLPWHIPQDLARFKRLTIGQVVIVGRRTQDSIVARLGRALPGRTSIVVTRQPAQDGDRLHYRPSFTSALDKARELAVDEVFVIGGAEIYLQALPEASTVHLTRVTGTHEGDTYLPPGWLDGFVLVWREPHEGFAYETWQREQP